jgi:hypothetical protein
MTILEADSTDDSTQGITNGVEHFGHVTSKCFHPTFVSSGRGDVFTGVVRSGTVHLVDGALDLISPCNLFAKFRSKMI